MKLIQFIKKNKSYVIFLILVSALWGVLLNTFTQSNQRNNTELIQLESMREQEHYERVLHNTLDDIESVKDFVETIGMYNITQADFEAFCERKDFSNVGFLSLNIAPDGIVEFYYSELLDDDIIGHNFYTDSRESVRNAIDYTIEHDVVVVNGPIDLILANQGIVLRRAIFDEFDNLTGIISFIIDYDAIKTVMNRQKSNVVDIGIYDENNNLIFGLLEYDTELENLRNIGIPEVHWRIGIEVNEDFSSRNLTMIVFIYIAGNLLYVLAVVLGTLFYFKNKRLIENQVKLINYDSLTKLPNRRLLNKNVSKAIKNNTPFYLGFGDLDNFKNLNDIMGHTVGDKFLKDITDRINETIDDVFQVYRWGGDEFIFLIFTEDKDIAIRYLDTLYSKISKPIMIKDSKYNIQISIGVVQYPRHGITADDLIKHADIVMYDIKSQKRNTYGFFENRYQDDLQREVDFEKKVNEYKISDFQVYLQPILDTNTNEIYGFEALSRLIDNEGHIINTFEVIKVLEKKGEIPKLDKHVFDTLCIYALELKKTFNKEFHFSFNISPITLSEELIVFLKEEIKVHGINPKNFVLEVTETLGFKDVDVSVSLLKEIKELGFDIAMDDFGMGYSSLSYIARLPIDIIKIDRYFIQNYYDNEFERLIIFAIKDISKSLNVKIVVEGIETTKQLDFIKELKAQYYQGYIFSKPMSIENIIKHLKEGF